MKSHTRAVSERERAVDERNVEHHIAILDDVISRYSSVIDDYNKSIEFTKGLLLGVMYGIVGNLWAHCFATVVFDGVYGLYVYGLMATTVILIAMTVYYWYRRRVTQREVTSYAVYRLDALTEKRALLEKHERE
jgi:hypothetical protein